MNRLERKTTAILLIAIFMISAFAFVSASPGITLTTNGKGTSEIVPGGLPGSAYCVKLYIPITVQAEYDAHQYDEARVVFSYGDALSSISGVSYNSHVSSGMEGKQHPYVTMAVDTGGDPAPDAWVVQLVVPDFGLSVWGETIVDDSTLVHVAGAQPGTPPDGGSWSNQGVAAAEATGQTLGNLKKTDFGAFKVVEFKVMNGEIVFTEAVTSHVDDVTINGFTYDFEPKTSASIDSAVRDPVISISVSPTEIDFGTLIRGHTSDPVQLEVTNIGEVSVWVSAEMYDSNMEAQEPGDFYYDNLLLGGTQVHLFGPFLTHIGLTTPLQLVVPHDAEIGSYQGILVFWAEEYTG